MLNAFAGLTSALLGHAALFGAYCEMTAETVAARENTRMKRNSIVVG